MDDKVFGTGNPDCLGAALLETLAKMAPTKEEELKLRNYTGDVTELGSAESFLKTIVDIPFAFRRVDAMLYRANFDSEVKYLKQSYGTLEVKLSASSFFRKRISLISTTIISWQYIKVCYTSSLELFSFFPIFKLALWFKGFVCFILLLSTKSMVQCILTTQLIVST